MSNSDDYLDDIGYDLADLPNEFLDGFTPALDGYQDSITPDDDVDDHIPHSGFRIERMGADGIWVAAFSNDDDLPDIHYDISCRDGGLHVNRRVEPTDTE
jgi:hypothetical protein